MTRLTTTLLYAVLFLACIHCTQSSTKKDLSIENSRRNMFGYMPDMMYYFLSYNRLMNKGNLQERRPFIMRRNLEEPQHNQRNLEFLKPITGLMGPLGGMLGGGKDDDAKTDEAKPSDKKSEEPKNEEVKTEEEKTDTRRRADSNEDMKDFDSDCPKTKSPICAVNYKKRILEFPSVCEFRKHRAKQIGWKLRNLGPCPKKNRKRKIKKAKSDECQESRVGDVYFFVCP